MRSIFHLTDADFQDLHPEQARALRLRIEALKENRKKSEETQEIGVFGKIYRAVRQEEAEIEILHTLCRHRPATPEAAALPGFVPAMAKTVTSGYRYDWSQLYNARGFVEAKTHGDVLHAVLYFGVCAARYRDYGEEYLTHCARINQTAFIQAVAHRQAPCPAGAPSIPHVLIMAIQAQLMVATTLNDVEAIVGRNRLEGQQSLGALPLLQALFSQGHLTGEHTEEMDETLNDCIPEYLDQLLAASRYAAAADVFVQTVTVCTDLVRVFGAGEACQAKALEVLEGCDASGTEGLRRQMAQCLMACPSFFRMADPRRIYGPKLVPQ
ncbi:MAG: hypothetical protein M3O22_00415 [Pseudomonadota bacterium]|nr:hypothetical protein [Pseudomonadota bacterium]